MISFDTPQGCFNLRAAAIVLHDDHVLVCREIGGDFWFLPGGRCEMMESSLDAVKRELREELGAEGRVERLLWIVENFFVQGGRTYHEIGPYFLVALPADSPILEKNRLLPFHEAVDIDLEARWFPLAETPSINLVPWFLREGLANPPRRRNTSSTTNSTANSLRRRIPVPSTRTSSLTGRRWSR